MQLVLEKTNISNRCRRKIYTGYGYRITVSDYRNILSNPQFSIDCQIEPLYQDIDGEIAIYPNIEYRNGKCYADFRNGVELDSTNEEMWYRGIHNASILMKEIEENQKEIFS